MSEKEIKEVISSQRRASQSSEEESSNTNPVAQMSLPSDSPTNQSSQSEPSTSAGATASMPEISVSATGSPSKSSVIKKKVQDFFKNLSPKKDDDASPKKSALSVVDLVASAVDVFRKSPERASLVTVDHGSPPQLPVTKPENYCKIDTFVKREGKRDTGNLTDTSSLSPSDGIPTKTQTSPETPSSAEDSPLIKPDKSSKKDSAKKKY